MLSPSYLKQNYGAFKVYLVFSLVLGLSAFAGFKLGQTSDAAQKEAFVRGQQTIENLDQENQQLVQQLNILKVQLDVEKMAASRTQATLQAGLAREAELEKQLNFYQKVMAPELTEKGFSIDQVSIYPAASDNHFHYEIVLMQLEKLKSVIKGPLDVQIHGSLNNKPSKLNLSKLLHPSPKDLAFSFKYFQVLEGQFALPEGFAPEKIEVKAEVFKFKRKRGDHSTSFDWHENLVDVTAE